jgi:hypothetical protein
MNENYGLKFLLHQENIPRFQPQFCRAGIFTHVELSAHG